MKKAIILVTMLVSFTAIAQQGINYKAVIKDDLGNIIANDLISVQFSILQGVAETNVYTENHTPTTDANGIIILNIGEGTAVSGDYSTIDWASDTHALNVQINIGAGLVDLGTTSFKAVPYANHALTSGDTKWVEGTTANDITNNNTGTVEIAGNFKIGNSSTIDEISNDATLANESDTTLPTQQAVKIYVDNAASGLEAIDEGNGIGWRLKGRNPANYGDIGLGAIDLSSSLISSPTHGATGDYSLTMGADNIAAGIASTAMGNVSTATGGFSTAMGFSTNASGQISIAMGQYTIASGNSSTAMGSNTTAPSFAETAIGSRNTVYTTNGASSWNPTDRLFVIGNGFESNSDALIILKNGTITAPSLDLNEITDDKALTTKEYVDNAAKGPIAYGFVQSSGNITSGSGNFSASWISANNRYEIDITGENYFWTLYTTNVTSASSTIDRIRVSSVAGKLLVYLSDSAGTLIQGNFQFTTFK